MKHIFGYGDTHNSFSIEKGHLYHLVRSGQTIAHFDTEEKARLYADGIQKGLDWGYATSYKRDVEASNVKRI